MGYYVIEYCSPIYSQFSSELGGKRHYLLIFGEIRSYLEIDIVAQTHHYKLFMMKPTGKAEKFSLLKRFCNILQHSGMVLSKLVYLRMSEVNST